MALEKIALDILRDPLAARAFAVNPAEYLERAGFSNIDLDLNSPQVRLALALGDPQVQEAGRQCEVEKFIDSILEQGFERPSRLVVELDNPDDPGLAAIELGVYFSLAIVSWIAAAYTVETAVAVHHKIGVAGVDRSDHENVLISVARHLGGDDFVRQVQDAEIQRAIAQYVSLHREHYAEEGVEFTDSEDV